MSTSYSKRILEGLNGRHLADLGEEGASATNKRSDTSQRLLVAAIELFGKNGVESTTMRELGKAVGIKAPAIYNHYRSKEEILAAALIWVMEDFNEHMFGADDPNEAPIQRLKGILERYVLYQIDNPKINGAFDVLFRSSALVRMHRQDAQEEVRRLTRIFAGTIKKVIAAIIQESGGETPPLIPSVYSITTMYDQIHRWYRPEGSMKVQELIDTYWRFTTNILGISGHCSSSQ